MNMAVVGIFPKSVKISSVGI